MEQGKLYVIFFFKYKGEEVRGTNPKKIKEDRETEGPKAKKEKDIFIRKNESTAGSISSVLGTGDGDTW